MLNMSNYSARLLVAATALVAAVAPSRAAAQTTTRSCSSHPGATENLGAQLAKFRPVQMPFNTTGLSTREVQMVRKLVEAGQDLESIFWRQSDPEGLAIYQALTNCAGAGEKQIRHYLLINGSRYDLLEATSRSSPTRSTSLATRSIRRESRARRSRITSPLIPTRRPRSTTRGRSSSGRARISSAFRITSSTGSGCCRRQRRWATQLRSRTTRHSRNSCDSAPRRYSPTTTIRVISPGSTSTTTSSTSSSPLTRPTSTTSSA